MLYGNNTMINSVGNVEDNNDLANMLLAKGIAEYFNFKYLSIRNYDVIDFMGALMSNTYDYKNPHSQYRPDWMNNTQGWRSDYQTKTLALQSGPSFARSHMFNAKELKNIQNKVKIDEETLKKKYGRDVPISWIEPKDIKKFIKSPKNCNECIKEFKKIFVSPSYRKATEHLCKKYFKVGMYKSKAHERKKSKSAKHQRKSRRQPRKRSKRRSKRRSTRRSKRGSKRRSKQPCNTS